MIRTLGNATTVSGTTANLALEKLEAARQAILDHSALAALVAVKAACVLAPSALASVDLLYGLMANQGSKAAALRAMAWASSIAPTNASLLRTGLRCALTTGDRRLSIRLSDEAARYYPTDFELRILAARALDRVGADASTMARAAIVLCPNSNDDAYLISWRELMKMNDRRGADRLIHRWKALSLSDRAFRAGCDTAAIRWDALSFVETVRQALDQGHYILDWQHRFTQLSNLLTASPGAIGSNSRLALSSRITTHPMFSEAFQRASLDRHETDAALRDELEGLKDPDLRSGLEALLCFDIASATDDFRRFASRGTGLPGSLSKLVLNGPDEGHPLWHVANPYYRVWADAATDTDPQINWQSNQVLANNPSESARDHYESWLSTPLPARDHLLSLVRECDPGSVRILDVGCGFGEWLRFLAQHAGVPLDNLYGVDFHKSRVKRTQETLRDAETGGATCIGDVGAVLARNILQRDLSQEVALGDDAFLCVDIVTMFVVTGCFNDSQLDRLIARIASLSPRYIFVTTVSRRWSLWKGRRQEGKFFKRRGFKEVQKHWLPETAMPDRVTALLLPKRYWTNLSARIYESV